MQVIKTAAGFVTNSSSTSWPIVLLRENFPAETDDASFIEMIAQYFEDVAARIRDFTIDLDDANISIEYRTDNGNDTFSIRKPSPDLIDFISAYGESLSLE